MALAHAGADVAISCNTGGAAADEVCHAIRDLGKFNARWPKEVRALITGRFPPETIGDVLSGGKDQIKAVMRFAGPRMLWEHPIMVLRHWWDGRRQRCQTV